MEESSGSQSQIVGRSCTQSQMLERSSSQNQRTQYYTQTNNSSQSEYWHLESNFIVDGQICPKVYMLKTIPPKEQSQNTPTLSKHLQYNDEPTLVSLCNEFNETFTFHNSRVMISWERLEDNNFIRRIYVICELRIEYTSEQHRYLTEQEKNFCIQWLDMKLSSEKFYHQTQ